MGLRQSLDKAAPHFEKGGKYERWYALYEALDTILYTPDYITKAAPHARDFIDMKRVMTYVVLATLPCVFMACWNTGFQVNLAIETLGETAQTGWRVGLMQALGMSFDSNNFFMNFFHGLLYFAPVYLVTLVVGGIWEVIFAVVRKHEIHEGFLVSSMLFALCMPPDAPWWQTALGISFGIVIGKEIFGGQGKNFLNPALTGRAFLYFAYPASMSGDTIWTPVDGFSGATALGLAAQDGGLANVAAADITWWDAFFGFIQGSLGETSTLACLIGLAFLMYIGVANFRLVFGCLISAALFSFLFNTASGGSDNPMMALPFWWHFVIGGFAFGLVFMVTEPVSAAQTNIGRWIYGGLIGFFVIMIRVINPAFPEGMMLAILLGNIFAPLVDYFVVQRNVNKRLKQQQSSH